MRRILFVIPVIVAFGIGLYFGGSDTPAADNHENATEQEQSPTAWTCSMHPQIKLPKAGQCPLCFMDLIPLEIESDDDLGPTTLVLSERAAALAEIQTTAVARRDVAASIRLTGKVDYDETGNRTIAAWVAGRIDTLFVDFTGTEVAGGDPLVSLYSPDLYAAQAELLNSVRAESELSRSSDELIRSTAWSTVEAGRERLRLWGLRDNQIAAIIDRGTARHHVRINAPVGGVVVHKAAMEGRYVRTGTPLYTLADLSKIWVVLDAFESDLAWLRTGQEIEFTVQAVPGRVFSGSIIFIDPVLDTRSRTVKIRLEVDNSDRLLKPGLFVSATAQAGLIGSDPVAPLIIPVTAPLITGERAVVYLRHADREKPTFEGREIVLGARAGDYYIVKNGLQEGDLVVTKGNFKLDSALQIQAKPSMMNPGDDGPAPETFAVAGLFTRQLGRMLDSYLTMQAALAADDDSGAREASRTLGESISAVDMSLVEGQAHVAWMSDLSRLSGIVGSIVSATDIAGRREHLLTLTPAVWETLRRFGYEQPEAVRLFNCPMANDNKGGDWIQLETTTANPYFGASMLRCGSQVDTLQIAAAHGGHK